jgi:hypothetical protein
MLEMIFQNNDLADDVYYHDDYQNHYLYHTYKNKNQNQKQKQKVIKNNMNDVYVNAKNDIADDDWGFYVEIDSQTPPRHLFPKKKMNTQPHLANPSYHHETTQQKNVNYLPQIQEEQDDEQFILELDLPHDHSNDKTYNYKEKISGNIFSGLTICALTTASIYFYSKIRSY